MTLFGKAFLRPSKKMIRHLGFASCIFFSSQAAAQTYQVTSSADTNTSGTLRYAINQANTTGGTILVSSTLTGGNTITLTSNLPVIDNSFTLTGPVGNTVTLSGNNQYQGFFVESGTVSISNLNVQNCAATGGAGGAGNFSGGAGGGGGGGMGGGAALFVAPSATVSLSSMNFNSNTAKGGPGGLGVNLSPTNPSGGAGGGGINGSGGIGGNAGNASTGGGGGGGGGLGAMGTNGFQINGGFGQGGGGNGGLGGEFGVPEPSTPGVIYGGGGGGGGGNTTYPGGFGAAGGNYGGGGGGGATPSSNTNTLVGGAGGNGGLGGGGGGAGGQGTGGATSAFAGGTGGVVSGGGGAGLGGGVFSAGTLTIEGFTLSANNVVGGAAGGADAAAGQGLAPDLFLQSGSNTTIITDAGKNESISTNIVSDNLTAGGSFVKQGGGILALDGNNNFIAPTTIQAGTLSLGGSLVSSPTTVLAGATYYVRGAAGMVNNSGLLVVNGTALSAINNQGATIIGSGTVIGSLINNGNIIPGNVMGGNPTGVLTAGSYVQGATANFYETISPPGALNYLQVNGNVQLNGGKLTVNVLPGFYPAGALYPVILGSGIRNGQFAKLDPPVQLSLIYTPSSVYLQVVNSNLFLPFTLSCNAARVANYINSLNIPVGSVLANQLALLPISPSVTQDYLDQLHPAIFQDLTFLTDENMNIARSTFTGRTEFLRHQRCKMFPNVFNDECNIGITQFWMAPFGLSIDQAHRGCLRGYRDTTGGVMLGIDSQPNSRYVAGIGGAYTYSNFHWKDAAGKATVESIYLGCYSCWMWDYIFVDAAVLGSLEWYIVNRDIDIIQRNAYNRHKGYAINSHLGIGGNFPFCGLQVEPFAYVDYDFVDQDGYREYKAKALDLRVHANHAHLIRSEGGATFSYCMPYNCAIFRPSVTVSYLRKDILQGERFVANFRDYPHQTFVAKGTREPLNYICPGIELQILFSDNHVFRLNYDAQLNRRQTTQSMMMTFERLY